METLFLSRYASPLGIYILVSSNRGVVCMKPEEQSSNCLSRRDAANIDLRENGGLNSKLAAQLDAYFAGKLRQFTVPLDLRGTPFQKQVWGLLCNIPYGETRSYRQIAEALGRTSAARAVGRANASNPVSIVVPCHRVIGAHGALTGYGGGLPRKKALLDLETRYASAGAL